MNIDNGALIIYVILVTEKHWHFGITKLQPWMDMIHGSRANADKFNEFVCLNLNVHIKKRENGNWFKFNSINLLCLTTCKLVAHAFLIFICMQSAEHYRNIGLNANVHKLKSFPFS